MRVRFAREPNAWIAARVDKVGDSLDGVTGHRGCPTTPGHRAVGGAHAAPLAAQMLL